ncbi:MAG: DUF2642 domain-containing protein [Clostridiaceae bacterium]
MKNCSYEMPLIQNNQFLPYTIQVEPYFTERLCEMVGQVLLIETIRGNLQGVLVDVKSDHVVIKSYDSDTMFYVRLKQIVQVMTL